MANRYKLEGESKGISLGGLFRVIGWFILIVVSILAAFNVYYWNESRETDQQKLQALSALKQESTQNAESLNEHTKSLKNQIAQLNLLLATANRTVDADSLLMAFYLLYEQTPIDIKKGAYRFLTQEVASQFEQSLRNNLVQFYETDLYQLQLQEKAINTFIDEQLTSFLIDERNLSLVNPTLKTNLVQISADQRNRIIRILLNNRTMLDLVYYRISQMEELMALERTIMVNATLLHDRVSVAIEQMNSEK